MPAPWHEGQYVQYVIAQAEVREMQRDLAQRKRSTAAPRKPVFVVGLPRTGTSFLHTLLAQDDAPATAGPDGSPAAADGPPA